MEGSHPIHRSILDHWVWKDKPFAMGQAWMDLILLANHTDSKAVLRGLVYVVKRGQVFRSKLVLGERWGWSRGRVERFLKLLENEQMIKQQAGQHATFITLLNYDRLHDTAFKKRTTDETPDRAPNGHQTDTRQDTYNKDNNDNNEKNLKKRSQGIFSEQQRALLGKETAQALNYGIDSEANRLEVEALIKRVAKAKGVKDKFGYAIASARNLKNGYGN
jgi:DNA replication protein DnaD